MKTTYKLATSLVPLILILQMFSFSGHAQGTLPQNLVGNWVMDTSATLADIPQNMQTKLDSFPQLEQQIIASYTGRALSLLANGEFQRSLANGVSISGTCTLTGSILRFEMANGAAQDLQMTLLPDGRLKLSSLAGPEEQIVVTNQYYTKL